MNRKEIVEKLRAEGYTKRDAEIILDDVVKIITEALAAGESVRIHGFGKFFVKDVKPHNVYNINTQETIFVPGGKVPHFTAGDLLKRAVKEGFVRE